MRPNVEARNSEKRTAWCLCISTFVLMSCAAQSHVDVGKVSSAKLYNLRLSESDVGRLSFWLDQHRRGWDFNFTPPWASLCYIHFSDGNSEYAMRFPGPQELKPQDPVFLGKDGKGYVIQSFSRAALEPLEEIKGTGRCGRVGVGLPS